MYGACLIVTGLRILMLCLVLSASAAAQGLLPADDGNVEVSRGEPTTLVVWNRPIVTLRARIGSITPAHRVDIQLARIGAIPYAELPAKVEIKPASIGKLNGYWIYAGNNIAIGLLEGDLEPESDQTLEKLASETASRLQSALRARYDQQQPTVLIHGLIVAGIATILFAVAVWIIGWARRRVLGAIEKMATPRPLIFRGFNLRPHFRTLAQGAVKLVALGNWLVALYLWLAFILVQFPYTKPWGDRLGEWLSGRLLGFAVDALTAIPGLFSVLVILWVTRAIARGVDAFFRAIESGRLQVDWLDTETARVTRRLAVGLVWLFALIVAYPYIPGSGSDVFKGVSVFMGLMISLGSTGYVNQIMSGLVIVYSRTFKPGDFVRVGDREGTISEVGLLSTKMITPTRQEITIPNAVAVGNQVVNFSRLAAEDKACVFMTSVTIGYDTPWRQVHALLLMAAGRTTGILKEPPPRIFQEALADFYVQYDLLFSIERAEDRRAILSELHGAIQDVFNEYGVQIMSPHFERQPDRAVVVPPSGWHAAPAPEPPDSTV